MTTSRTIGRAIFLGLVLGSSVDAWSQHHSGSIYSLFGLGQMVTEGSDQSNGMGMASIALNENAYLNPKNPALSPGKDGSFNQLYSMGFYTQGWNYHNGNTSEQAVAGGLSHLYLWFRLNQKWSLTTGIAPLTRVGYNIVDPLRLDESTSVSINYRGSGGINRYFISNSIQLWRGLSLGVRLSLLSGSIKRSETTREGQSDEVKVAHTLRLSKGHVDLGLNYTFKLPRYDLNIGLIYDPEVNFNATQTTTLSTGGVSSTIDRTSEMMYSLPRKMGVGLSAIGKQLTVSADVEHNQWSKVTAEGGAFYRDTWRYALGLQFIPNARSLNMLNRINYRIGGYWQQSPLVIDQTSFDEWGITVGFTLPFRNGSRLNLAYQRKFNGTLTNSLIQESIHEVTLSITIGNKWFQKRDYR